MIGTWELLSREDRTQDGQLRIDPALGPDPLGLLIYDSGGRFAAQFMKRERAATAGDVPAGAAVHPNSTRALGGYDAYFGTYAVDDSAGMVTQTLVAALAPDNVGKVVTRALEVSGDTLTIRIASASAHGEPITRTLLWRRVA
jgi:hypothetical protein